MRCPRCLAKNPEGYLFCTRCGAPLQPGEEKMRFATVLFFDLSDFTKLLAEEGPEAASKTSERAFEIAREVIEARGGEVYTTYGDGLLAVFGLGKSSGAEAKRAVAAAKAVVERIEELYHRGELALTGRAVVTSGLVLAKRQKRRLNLFGDPLNRAQRLMTSTPAGAVYLDETTAGMAAGLWLKELKPLRAKGFSDPIKAFSLLGFKNERATLPDPELLLAIERAWERARAGEGQVVVLVGPPGAGKRLLAESFLAGLEPGRVFRFPELAPRASLRGWLRGFLEANPGVKERLLSLPLSPAEKKRLAVATGLRPGKLPDQGAVSVVAKALSLLAEEPVVLFIEGLHRAPKILLEFLYAWQSAKGKVLILGTARSGEFPITLPVAKKSQAEAEAWLEEAAPGSDRVSRSLAAALSDGLLGLGLKLLPSPQEERLAALLQPHFDALGPAKEALFLLASLPEPTPKAWLKALLGERAEELARVLVHEGFVAWEGEDLVFKSRAYRRAAMALTPQAKRKAWKRALAEWHLARKNPEEAARCYAGAGLFGSAIRVLRALAHETGGEEAVRYLKKAKALSQNPEQRLPVQLELAEHLLKTSPAEALVEVEGLSHPRAQKTRGLALLALGRHEEAAAALISYLVRNPEDEEVWLRLISSAPREILVRTPLPPAKRARLFLAERLEELGELGRAELAYRGAFHQSRGDEAAKIALALSGVHWKRLKHKDARAWAERAYELAEEEATRALAAAVLAGLHLDAGELSPARARLDEAFAHFQNAPCDPAYARAAGIEVRYYLELGEYEAALERALYHLSRCPDPWLSALFLLVLALKGEGESVAFQARAKLKEAKDHHTRAVLHLAAGIAEGTAGKNPLPSYRAALKEAKKVQNPYVWLLSLSGMLVYYLDRDPQKSAAIAERLLKIAWPQGYLPYIHLARLARAEIRLKEGKPVASLLRFESPYPALEFWRKSLLKAAGEPVPPPKARSAREFGVLGKTLLYRWEGVWTQGKRSARG